MADLQTYVPETSQNVASSNIPGRQIVEIKPQPLILPQSGQPLPPEQVTQTLPGLEDIAPVSDMSPNYLVNPYSGEVFITSNRAEYNKLSQMGFAAPSIDQLKEAGMLNLAGQTVSNWGIVPSVAVNLIPTKNIINESGNSETVIDIDKSVFLWGENAPKVLALKAADPEKTFRVTSALVELRPYKRENGYDLASAISKGVSQETLKNAGYSDEIIADVIKVIELKETPVVLQEQTPEIENQLQPIVDLTQYKVINNPDGTISYISYETTQDGTGWNDLSDNDKRELEILGVAKFNELMGFRKRTAEEYVNIGGELIPRDSLYQLKDGTYISKLYYDNFKNPNTNNLTGLALFNDMVAQGLIPEGSVYIEPGDKPGTVKYYDPDTVVVVGNNEVVEKETYNSFSPEIQKLVNLEGLSGLFSRIETGDMPLPEILGDSWFNNETGEVATTEELKARYPSYSIEWDKWTRNKSAYDTLDDLQNAIATSMQNKQTKVANWAEKTTGNVGTRPVQNFTEMTGYVARGLSSAGLAAAAMIPMLITTVGKLAIRPTEAPEVGKQFAKGIKNSFSTVAQVITQQLNNAGGTSVTPEELGMATLNVALILDAASGTIQKITTWVAPKGVPGRIIGRESATSRIPVKDIDPVALGKAMGEAEIKGMQSGGSSTGTITVGATNYELHYVKTPLESKIGNILWHGTTEGLDFIKESGGKFAAGKSGFYTDPWAALAYTKGSNNTGIVMVITDSSKVKVPPAQILSQLPTNSDAFIRGASEGAYTSSKTWLGDFESEIVYSPGSEFYVPKPSSDLLTRALVGKYSDFFTYNGERFVPIKIAIDKSILKSGDVRVPTVADLYAAKLGALKTALQDTAFTIQHPGTFLSDIIKLRSNPGVRNIYLMQEGKLIKDIAQSISDRTSSLMSRGYSDAAIKSIIDSEYNSAVSSLISNFPAVAGAYSDDSETKNKFEALYSSALNDSLEALVKTSELTNNALQDSGVRLEETPIITDPVSSLNTSSTVASITPSIISTPESVETPIEEVTSIETRETMRSPIVNGIAVSSASSEPAREQLIVSSPISSKELEYRESRIVSPPQSSRVIEPPRRRTIIDLPYREFIAEPPRSIISIKETPPHSIISIKETPPRVIEPPFKEKEKKKDDDFEQEKDKELLERGSIAWRQGALNGQPVWYLVRYPFETERDVTRYIGSLPPGVRDVVHGKGSALRSIQTVTGKAPDKLVIDLGVQDITIFRGETILYTQDEEQETRGDITIGGNVRTIKKKNPLIAKVKYLR